MVIPALQSREQALLRRAEYEITSKEFARSSQTSSKIRIMRSPLAAAGSQQEEAAARVFILSRFYAFNV
jgi:hypothetical protein